MANSILQYYKPVDHQLPNPRGPLSQRISSAAIASANREVQSLLSKTRKRSPYQRYIPEERAVIARFATEHGVPAAVRRYSKYPKKINESTIRVFKKAYLEELSRKRQNGEEDLTVKQLCHKKRGRPLLLGSSLDDAVKAVPRMRSLIARIYELIKNYWIIIHSF